MTKAKAYLSQNDGTLMTLDVRAPLPHPHHRLRPHELHLRGQPPHPGWTNAIVIDVGGTTTDLGVHAGRVFRARAGVAVTIGGVRTNFRMPDVVSIGLGGGSIVRVARPDGTVTVGPDSVGYQHRSGGARVRGRRVLTATDVSVRLGMAAGGRPGARGRRALRRLGRGGHGGYHASLPRTRWTP